MIIRQLEVGHMDNFCYLVGCEKTCKAMLIDPGADVERIMAEAKKERLVIETIVNTHGHGDHTAGCAKLKALTGARIIMHDLDAAAVPETDLRLTGDQDLQLGAIRFQVIHTPGHTLFVGDSGRTDLAGGHRPTLAASIRRLMQLPDDTVIWPGHDYGPSPFSTIAWEKRHNVNAREYGYYVKE
jgi:hydroxyacylglutathione hydrolase